MPARFFRELSLRQRLLLLTMLTSGVGSASGCIGFLAYDMHAARVQKVEELSSTAALIKTNSAAALTFDDAMGGSKLLDALQTRPHIRLGVLYRMDGSFFASYTRSDLTGKTILPETPPQGIVWSSDRLTLDSPVLFEGRGIGSLYLEADSDDLHSRLKSFEQLTAVIAVGSLLLVYFLTAALQRSISRPILELAEIARSVAAQKSYSMRAPPLAGKELRQLSADFNHMLEEIQRRDDALTEARDTLEMRVAARTNELEAEVVERRRAEQALQERTTFLNTLMVSNPLAIAVLDERWQVELVNPAFLSLFGYTREEVTGRELQKLVASEGNSDEISEMKQGLLDQNSVRRKTSQRKKKDGRSIDVEIQGVPLLVDGGVRRTLIIYQDISERMQAQKSLRESEELFRNLSAAAPVGIFMDDLDGNCRYVNPAWEEMTGCSAAEAMGMGWLPLLHPEDRERVLAEFKEATERGRLFRSSFRYLAKRGNTVRVEAIGRSISNETAGSQGYIGVIQDVTERYETAEHLREAKEAAEAASQAKSEFLANMSHEIRTPMNGILGMTELALDTELKPEQREYLGMVKSSAESLLGIINDILDFSKIEAGKLELECIPFSVLDCIESALHPLAVRAQQKGLELTWSVEGEIPELVAGDPTRLRQILMNLAGNAIKFTKEGEVNVKAEGLPSADPATTIRFTVSDTGVGIPQEKHKQIFEAFSQADTSTTREFGGTGLGLSICARLVQLMHGELRLESKLEKGSTFFFSLQFTAAAATEAMAPAMPHPGLAGKSALVVDDNEINRRLLLRLLPQFGMRPVAAADGFEALAAFENAIQEEDPFSIVLLDQNMPGMDGYEVARRIRVRSTKEQAAILILSSSPTAADHERAEALGIARRLVKPIRRAVLREAILQALHFSSPVVAEFSAAGEEGRALTLRLLLAEDNRVNQTLATRVLEKLGHHVTLAVNGKEAVELAQKGVFDLVLMDIQMPVMGGLEALKKIREWETSTGSYIPIIAMTAHAMSGDAQKFRDSGMDGYVSKPIRFDVLRGEMNRVMKYSAQKETSNMHEPEVPRVDAESFDFPELLARVDYDRELLVDLLTIFREDFPRHLQALREAIASQDATSVATAGHTLKGMLSNLAAARAAGIAGQIEKLGREGNTPPLAALLNEFEVEAKNLLPQLEAYVAEVPS